MNTQATTAETTISAADIKDVYIKLRDRIKNPMGEFDSAGRFYAHDRDLINVRIPSRSWPYPELTACRTLKFVKALAAKYNCKTKTELEFRAFA